MNDSIMIVDDNDFVRSSVQIVCECAALAVTAAASGAECLRQLEAGFRGVILMDVMMPEMDGWDTIREIARRGLYPGNLIVMLTGMGEPGLKMEGIQEYVTDYLTKPFGPDQLIESLQYYLILLDSVRA
ncbi:MAG TPA: response regulator [Geomonas sp.]|nr:response regulator [Geomonas sp.]